MKLRDLPLWYRLIAFTTVSLAFLGEWIGLLFPNVIWGIAPGVAIFFAVRHELGEAAKMSNSHKQAWDKYRKWKKDRDK